MGQLSFNEDGTISIPEKIKDEIPNYLKNKSWSKNKNSNGNGNENGDDDFDLNIFDGEAGYDEEKHNIDDDVSGFNLYFNGQKLNQLKFSNNKTQEDVVNEILENISVGKKVVFVRGVCGSGKSVVALNLAKKMGKASIVVPGKALQKQYMEDYSGKNSSNKYVLKQDHKKIRIKVITGRENHKCLFSLGCSANDSLLPCKIEIKEANLEKLKEYLSQNNKVKNDLVLKEIRRISVAPVCPYWSPIVPSEFDYPLGGEKVKYRGLKGIDFTIYNRKKGCTYYNQFNSYLDAEVLVFNSAKYKLELLMNRKPETNIDIIDECDEFLDSFSNVKRINLNRLLNSLGNLNINDESLKLVVKRIYYELVDVIEDEHVKTLIKNREILPLKSTKILDILNYFIENQKLTEDLDDDNYCQTVNETALEFEDFFDDVFVSFSQEERGLVASIAVVNLAKKFKEMVDKLNAVVLMSGTVHSESVLRDIFGIENFAVVDAEIVNQGKVDVIRTGFEIDCRYDNFVRGVVTRKDYLIALDKAIEKSVKPTLVHVNSFNDLPDFAEKENYKLNNLISRDKLIEMQKQDKEQKIIERFKKKEFDVLFTTKCGRGVDFPGEQCRSIVFTKYPNPDVDSIFWKMLKKNYPTYYWEFYKDKAKREFLQKIYRGVRSKEDYVYVLSPDLRVINAISFLNI